MEKILKKNEEQIIEDKQNEITDFDYAVKLYDGIYETEAELRYRLFPNTSIKYDFGIKIDREFWEEMIYNNVENQSKKDESFDEHYKKILFDNTNEEQSIIDLFANSE